MISSPRPTPWLPVAGLALTIAIWASHNIVGKIIMQESSPLLVALVRFTLAGLLFHVPVFISMNRGSQRLTGPDWKRLVVLGVVGTTGSLVLYLSGLRTTPATEAGIYQITTPLFVAFLAWVWLGERLSRSRLAGFFVATLGATVLVTGGGAIGLGGGDLPGALFLLGSNVAWAAYTLMSKRLLARRPPLLVVSAVNVIAMGAIWVISGFLGVWAELPNVLAWSPTAWMVMLYLVVVMAAGSQWLYVVCLREVEASQASASLYLTPFFTAIMAAVFLGELPTLLSASAGLLILIGVWLVNQGKKFKGERLLTDLTGRASPLRADGPH